MAWAFVFNREGLRVCVGAGDRAEDLAGDRLWVLPTGFAVLPEGVGTFEAEVRALDGACLGALAADFLTAAAARLRGAASGGGIESSVPGADASGKTGDETFFLVMVGLSALRSGF